MNSASRSSRFIAAITASSALEDIERRDRQALSAKRLGQLLATAFDGVLAAFALEPLADLGLGPRRLGDAQPVARRSGGVGLAGDDLDDVGRAQHRVERHETSVHLRAHAVVPDLGVHGVGEVDRRRALDERDDPALGREDVDLVLAEVELQGLEEGDRVVLFLFDVGEALHPGDSLARGALLVAPVRRDAELGAPVHLLGANLDLDRTCPAGR